MSLDTLGLPARVERILRSEGLETVDDLTTRNAREIIQLRGIGAHAVAQIEEALTKNGLILAEDPWAPYACARHAEASWDTGLQSFFLCSECQTRFREGAFNGTEPEYIGPGVAGHCLHCNRWFQDVRLAQWNLCAVCDRVMRSIGRSVVADDSVLEWWEKTVQPRFPTLDLLLTDPPRLEPRKRERPARIPQVDFTCTDASTGEDVFGIELKTGRSHVRPGSIGSRMQQFQLDHSDCDDILAVVRRESIPVYLAHAQVIDRADPPTIRYMAVGLWWTDLYTMLDHYQGSRQRPRETRTAAYYSTDMFRDSDAFVNHLAAGGPQDLKARLEREGPPELYRSAAP